MQKSVFDNYYIVGYSDNSKKEKQKQNGQLLNLLNCNIFACNSLSIIKKCTTFAVHLRKDYFLINLLIGSLIF